METPRSAVGHKCRIFAFALVLLVIGGSMPSADSGSTSFSYLLAPDFVCGDDPSFCPDIARAANGDTIGITGAGTLGIHPKTVAGGGTFTYKNSAGAVISTGAWTATALLSFNDYGTSPEFPIPGLHGGRAIIWVHLTPSTGGAGFDASLQVVCAINPPPGHAAEGVRLAVQGGPNFNKEVSGLTAFFEI